MAVNANDSASINARVTHFTARPRPPATLVHMGHPFTVPPSFGLLRFMRARERAAVTNPQGHRDPSAVHALIDAHARLTGAERRWLARHGA